MSCYTHPIPDHSKCQWFHSQECRQFKVLVKDQEENRTEDWVTKAMEVKDEESSSSSSEDKRASKSKTKALWPVLLSRWALLSALPMIWHNMWFSMFQSGKANRFGQVSWYVHVCIYCLCEMPSSHQTCSFTIKDRPLDRLWQPCR